MIAYTGKPSYPIPSVSLKPPLHSQVQEKY